MMTDGELLAHVISSPLLQRSWKMWWLATGPSEGIPQISLMGEEGMPAST